ncbi:MAG: acyltransferase [Candidatus Dojkabacteria bacterium]|nr:MAG: acyltransferase [Candidatus Dojkabacteria bacterium]
MRKREGTLDLIRIIASFGVLTIHVLAWLLEQPYTELEKYFLWVVHTLAPTGTRLFVMITGYFLLAYEFQKSLLVVSRKIRALFLPLFVWSLFYGVVFVLEFSSGSLFERIETIKSFLVNLLDGRPYYHLWYLFLLPFLLAVVPYLVSIRERISDMSFLKLGIFLLLFRFFDFAWRAQQNQRVWIPLLTVDYLSLLILGYWLGRTILSMSTTQKITVRKLSVLGIGISLLSSLFMPYSHLFHFGSLTVFEDVLRTLYMIFLFSFALTFHLKSTPLLTNLAYYGMGIYLIHPVLRTIIVTLVPYEWFFALPIGATVMVFIVVVYTISILFSALLYKFPGTRKLISL